jgi:hypothetical protein
VRLFLYKRKNIRAVCRAHKKRLACLTLVTISYKRSLESQPSDVNIYGQQTISQLIIDNQLIFDCGDGSAKCKGYLVPKLLTIVFRMQIKLVS